VADYVDRWWQEQQRANDSVKSMWERYRTRADEIGSAVRKKL
jgi:hypothetical protein